MADDVPSLAELYDHEFAADTDDVAFYRDLAVDADGPVLELACGTGRVHLELLAAGADAVGIDLDPDFLARLRAKADARGLDPDVRRGDMTDFETDRAFALVVCPFNAVQHALDVDAQSALFDCAHDALAPGGRFVFDTFVPSFDLVAATYGEWQTQSLSHGGREFTLRARSTVVDEVEQRFRVERVLEGPDGDVVHESAHPMSMLPKQQVELLARRSRFADWSVAGGFDGEPISAGDGVQVWTLEKRE